MTEDQLPFTLRPVVGKDFVGREKLVSEIVSQLSSDNKMGYSLHGIRRVGKTSVIKEAEMRLNRLNGPVFVYISVWRVAPSTVDEFVKVTTRAALSSFHPRLPVKFKFQELLVTGKEALTRLAQGMKLSAKVADDLEVSLSYIRKESDDVDAAITSCFSLVEHLAEMCNVSAVLAIDEFPSLADLTYGSKNQKIGDSIIKLVRTLYEDFGHTKLVVAGSYKHTLSRLVTGHNAPFYKQLLMREVKTFTPDEFDSFLERYLPGVKFDLTARQWMYEVTSGIPYNLQLVGGRIHDTNMQNLDTRSVNSAVRDVLEDQGDLSFQEDYEALTPSQVKTCKALATTPGIRPGAIATSQFMERNAVDFALTTLVKRGVIIRKEKGSYVLADNLFGEWLKLSDEERV